MKQNRIILTFIVGLSLLSAVFAADAKPAADKGKVKSYPLDTCIVTENDLDSMGGEVTKVYKGQEVKFCCRPCIKKFDKNPEKYLSRLEQPPGAERKIEPHDEPKKP